MPVKTRSDFASTWPSKTIVLANLDLPKAGGTLLGKYELPPRPSSSASTGSAPWTSRGESPDLRTSSATGRYRRPQSCEPWAVLPESSRCDTGGSLQMSSTLQGSMVSCDMSGAPSLRLASENGLPQCPMPSPRTPWWRTLAPEQKFSGLEQKRSKSAMSSPVRLRSRVRDARAPTAFSGVRCSPLLQDPRFQSPRACESRQRKHREQERMHEMQLKQEMLAAEFEDRFEREVRSASFALRTVSDADRGAQQQFVTFNEDDALVQECEAMLSEQDCDLEEDDVNLAALGGVGTNEARFRATARASSRASGAMSELARSARMSMFNTAVAQVPAIHRRFTTERSSLKDTSQTALRASASRIVSSAVGAQMADRQSKSKFLRSSTNGNLDGHGGSPSRASASFVSKRSLEFGAAAVETANDPPRVVALGETKAVKYSDGDFLRIARSTKLDIIEVRDLYEDFKAVDCDCCGRLTGGQFAELIRRHMQISEDEGLPRIFQSEVERIVGGNGLGFVDFEACCVWAVTVAFNRSAKLLTPQEQMLRDYARRYGMDLNSLERTLAEFKKYDTNSNGSIDKDEFKGIVGNLMNSRAAYDIPVDRLNRFWSEVDKDGDGEVCFEEFFQWYLRYFPGGFDANVRCIAEEVYKKLGTQRTSSFYTFSDDYTGGGR
mmetsp:Transcript_18566/g.51792  ORF Transcript_18566/g.51792 Transcript_18566/m.51792 type:complete len:665 (+) Transcript_18566:73-2067(+)